MARPLLGAVIAVAALGCRQLNPLYCADHPDDPDCRTAGLVTFDAPNYKCTSNDACAMEAGKPVCDLGSHTCVECLPNVTPMTCTGTKVCGEDFTCHGCIVDTNCPDSLVCTPSGSCALAENVVYAKPAGAGDCSMTNPCPLAMAVPMLSAQHYILKLTPTFGTDYTGPPLSFTLPANQVLQILGTGTKFTPNIAGSAITITGGNVEIVGVRVEGATAGNGVQCTGGRLTLRRMDIANNALYGISTTGCSVFLERSKISGNPSGAMRVDTADIEIRNNFMVGNGSGNLTAGNIVLRNVVGRFVFNTVADNDSKNGNNTSGIDCTQMGNGVTVSRNIIASNGGANNATSGTCAISGTTNYINDSLTEIGFAPGDYHLTAVSLPNMVLNDPLADADCHYSGNYIDDIDGQPRPVDFCDRGADEYRP